MRDYRDAKTMAQALRKGLAAQDVSLTHSQSLELIAQAFGLDNWNILAAKIEAERLSRPQPAPTSSGMKTLYCSFCGKSQYAVQTLIAGPDVFICNECNELCDGILFDAKLGRAIGEALALPGADPTAAVADVLMGYGDDQLLTLRKSNTNWSEHIEWAMRAAAARLDGGEPPGPWPHDADAAERRPGWRSDPLARKSDEEVAQQRATLAAQLPRVRERLLLIERVLEERGLA